MQIIDVQLSAEQENFLLLFPTVFEVRVPPNP